jgi:hypothetical protein
MTTRLVDSSVGVGERHVKGSWYAAMIAGGEMSSLVLWVRVQAMSGQRAKRIQESERGRTGKVVQAALGYKAGF